MKITRQAWTDKPVQALAAELAEHYTTRYGAHDLDANDPKMFGPPRGAVLVGWSDGQPVGMLSVIPGPDPGVCEWVRAYVVQEHRSRGWYRRLMSSAAEVSTALGYTDVIGATRPPGLAVVRAAGLRPVEIPPVRELDAMPGYRTYQATLPAPAGRGAQPTTTGRTA